MLNGGFRLFACCFISGNLTSRSSLDLHHEFSSFIPAPAILFYHPLSHLRAGRNVYDIHLTGEEKLHPSSHTKVININVELHDKIHTCVY